MADFKQAQKLLDGMERALLNPTSLKISLKFQGYIFFEGF